MAPRSIWNGSLRIGELNCRIALHAAASTAERISFHMLNRKTGNRLARQYVDEETGAPVGREDQVKGYETGEGDYVLLEPEEVEAAVPESDKTLDVEAFIPCAEVDTAYLDRPYYVTPADEAARAAFAVIREGMGGASVAALAAAVLFRRQRMLLIRAQGRGLVAATLKFDHEVRPARQAFKDIADLRIGKEMMDLARHIIRTKEGSFDPVAFDDRYDAALAQLVKAKIAGKKPPSIRPKREEKVVDLMEALRRSAAGSGKMRGPRKAASGKAASRKAGAAKRKAG